MADKVGGGPNVRDLIRKFEEGTTENSEESAEKKSSGKDTDVIEKGLVAKRTAELEGKTSTREPQNLTKDDFEGLRDKSDGFVREMASRWTGKLNPRKPTEPSQGLNRPHADGMTRTTSSATPLPFSAAAMGDIEISPELDPTMAKFSYKITKMPADLNAPLAFS